MYSGSDLRLAPLLGLVSYDDSALGTICLVSTSGPRLIKCGQHLDGRGTLAWWEDSDLPFALRRVYYAIGPEGSVRGGHGHLELQQVLVCLRGRLNVELWDRQGRMTQFTLCDPTDGLYVPPAHWRDVRFESDSILLVLASRPYDASDYSFDRAEFST